MSTDRLEQYRIFMQVADRGSFTRAADALGLPRATVSTVVQRLETQLGTRLLHRTTRQVSLTPDGEQLLERLRPLLLDADGIECMFAPQAHQVAGRLQVEVPSRIARKLVVPALPMWLKRYPHMQLVLGSSDRSANLVQEGIDCVIRIGAVADSSLVARPLGALRMVNCASPAYLHAHGIPVALDDLSLHRTVGYASPSSGRVLPWEYLDASGAVCGLDVLSAVVVNNAETYLACCRAGLGLIQVPRYDVQELLARGELVEVLPDWLPQPMNVTALYPHRRQYSSRLAVFIEWLQGLLNPHVVARPHERMAAR